MTHTITNKYTDKQTDTLLYLVFGGNLRLYGPKIPKKAAILRTVTNPMMVTIIRRVTIPRKVTLPKTVEILRAVPRMATIRMMVIGHHTYDVPHP